MTAASILPIIEGLETDPLYAITVSEVGDSNYIESNATAEVLTTKYGGVAEFFNRLNSQNRTHLIIQVRRSNGSKAFVNKGTPQIINLAPPQQQPAPIVLPSATALNGAVQHAQPDYGMSMPMGLGMGLSAPDMYYRVMDHPNLQRERDDLKSKNEVLKEQVIELKEKIHEMKFDTSSANAKSERLAGLMETGINALPVIMQMMAGNAGVATQAMPGLGNPAQGLSLIHI